MGGEEKGKGVKSGKKEMFGRGKKSGKCCKGHRSVEKCITLGLD